VGGILVYQYLGQHRTYPIPNTDPPQFFYDWENGEMQLPRPFLFTYNLALPPVTPPNNIRQIRNQNAYTMQYGEAVSIPVPCAEVKSLGISIARTPVVPVVPSPALANPDYVAGPEYRCRMSGPSDLIETWDCADIIPCGETIEFLILDYNECADPAAVQLYVKPIDCDQVSAVCTWYNDSSCQRYHGTCSNVVGGGGDGDEQAE
jgi:hypothetical protein